MYKRVRDAQAFAKKLGVQEVEYGGNLVIANLANHVLFLAHQRKAPLPRIIRVRPFNEQGDQPNQIAFYQPGLGDAPGEIEINSTHFFWNDPTANGSQAKQKGIFSTGSSQHPIAHEFGELAMHQSVGGDRFYSMGEQYQLAEAAFQAEDLDHVRNVVSRRATANLSEFVAEVFAALLLNGGALRQDAEIMQLYQEYGGADMRRYDGGE